MLAAKSYVVWLELFNGLVDTSIPLLIPNLGPSIHLKPKPTCAAVPYLKLGAVYIIKNLRAFYSNGTVSSPIVDQGTAAQVGLGFKWMLGDEMATTS
jgi:hypothetical protein